MIEALKHPNESVRVDAALALFKVGDERAIPALTAALEDPAATDPAVLHRGDRSWEEMGSDEPDYLVRKAARLALDMIRRRHPAPTTAISPNTGETQPAAPVQAAQPHAVEVPFQVGDIVEQYRHHTQDGFVNGPRAESIGTKWKVVGITDELVSLELVEGIEDWTYFKYSPGDVMTLGSSEYYRAAFPDSKGYQQVFDTFRKIGKKTQ